MNTIEFAKVTFRYSEASNAVLDDVSFSLQKGKSYALVGPTGQGKSTTASLMARLYTPTEGKIIFEGKELGEWSEEELYDKIGFILQEPYLYSGTVLDNIIYGNPQYLDKYDEVGNLISDTDELIHALEKKLFTKGLHTLIEVFPDGLRTIVTNNSENISLGQKQIINFVRVILREPSFLILDEATANLDTITEKTLQNIIQSLPKDTTKLIIAHRLNTIKDVDQVFLVGGGNVKKKE